MIHKNFELNSRLTWEEVINSINDLLNEWWSIWGGEYTIDEFQVVEEDIVQEVFDESGDSLGKCIRLRTQDVRYTSENWADFQRYVETAKVQKYNELQLEYIESATDDCEEYEDFTTEEEFEEGETAGLYYDKGSKRIYKIRTYDSHMGKGDDYYCVEYDSNTNKYTIL